MKRELRFCFALLCALGLSGLCHADTFSISGTAHNDIDGDARVFLTAAPFPLAISGYNSYDNHGGGPSGSGLCFIGSPCHRDWTINGYGNIVPNNGIYYFAIAHFTFDVTTPNDVAVPSDLATFAGTFTGTINLYGCNIALFSISGCGGHPPTTPSDMFSLVNTYDASGTASATVGVQGFTLNNTAIGWQNIDFAFSGTGATVPEPSSVVLLGSGICVACGIARRRLGRKSS